MPAFTTIQRRQLADLRDAADSGLPARLGRFIHLTCDAIERREYLDSRPQMQEYIDTLTDLIDTKVHHPEGRGRPQLRK
jgi:hypothetical protein